MRNEFLDVPVVPSAPMPCELTDRPTDPGNPSMPWSGTMPSVMPRTIRTERSPKPVGNHCQTVHMVKRSPPHLPFSSTDPDANTAAVQLPDRSKKRRSLTPGTTPARTAGSRDRNSKGPHFPTGTYQPAANLLPQRSRLPPSEGGTRNIIVCPVRVRTRREQTKSVLQ